MSEGFEGICALFGLLSMTFCFAIGISVWPNAPVAAVIGCLGASYLVGVTAGAIVHFCFCATRSKP